MTMINESNHKKGIIKELDVEKFRKKENVCSDRHFVSNQGITESTEPNAEYFNQIISIIKRADSQGLLKETSNDISTQIDNTKVTIRVYIENGNVLSINCFRNETPRLIYNLIELNP